MSIQKLPPDCSYLAHLDFNTSDGRLINMFVYQPDEERATLYSLRKKAYLFKQPREWFEVDELQRGHRREKDSIVFKSTSRYKYGLSNDGFIRRESSDESFPTIEQEVIKALDRLPFKIDPFQPV